MYKHISFCMVFILLISSLSTCVCADEYNFPSTSQLVSDDKQKTIISNLNVSSLSSPETRGQLLCFDVTEDGRFAVGFDSLPRKVCVFNKNGDYQYGFSFSTLGDFEIMLTETGVLTYLIRSHLCVEINSNAAVMNITEIPPTLENNKYWRTIASKTTVEAAGKQYKIKGNSKLVCVNENNSETVLFETTKTLNFPFFISAALLVIIFSVVAILWRDKGRFCCPLRRTQNRP